MLARSLAACAAAVLTTAALAACSPSDTDTEVDASPTAPTGCPVTMSEAWVKAVDSGMTAAFGTLANPSSESVTITAATSPAAAMVELHEVVDSDGSMLMRPVEDGFFVPAQGTQVLEPGGYHLMLMDVGEPIAPGDDVALTLTCASGASMSFTAQAKTFDGADEPYSGGSGDGMPAAS